MDKNERLKIAYQYLKGRGIVHTQKDLAEKMGATPPNVSSAFNGVETVLTDKFLYRFNKAFNNIFNIDWLLLGVGDMLNGNIEKTIKERLVQYLNYKNITSQQFELSLGYPEGFVDSITDKTHPYKIDKILFYYKDLNRNWLLTGEGDMLNSEQSPSLSPTTDKVIADNDGNNQSPPHVIKYYPNVNGSMGGVQFLDDPDETVCDITIPGYSDCKFAINAYGDSMHPLIKSGQIILMSEWFERFVDWGHIYLVVTKNGYRAVKRLYPGSSDGTVTCKSENNEYEPFEIEKSDIVKLFLVKGWICRDAI